MCITPSPRALAGGLAAALALVATAHATEQKVMTNARPASAASAADAVRTQKFSTHHSVPAMLTSRRDAVITDGWRAQFRFSGQADEHTCTFHLPKSGQMVRRGETATGAIVCTTPWQLYDNGFGFRAFENGQPVAEGTLRP